MPHPQMFDDDDPFLARVREIALALPQAAERVSHGRPAFFTKNTFCYYGASVRVDGEWEQHPESIAVYCAEDEREAWRQAPAAFVPAYLGAWGWTGFDLDEQTDWDEVAELITESYLQTAPPKLAAQVAALLTD